MADASGWDSLTMSEVAGRLGVQVASLYKHVAGLAGLRRGICLDALDDLAGRLARATAGRSRGNALRELAGTYREFAQSHPGRYAATVRAPPPGDAEHHAAVARVLDVVFAVLAGYGVTGEAAVDATRALRSALHGFVALEAAGGFGIPQDVDRSFERMVDGIDLGLRTGSVWT